MIMWLSREYDITVTTNRKEKLQPSVEDLKESKNVGGKYMLLGCILKCLSIFWITMEDKMYGESIFFLRILPMLNFIMCHRCNFYVLFFFFLKLLGKLKIINQKKQKMAFLYRKNLATLIMIKISFNLKIYSFVKTRHLH